MNIIYLFSEHNISKDKSYEICLCIKEGKQQIHDYTFSVNFFLKFRSECHVFLWISYVENKTKQ